jgi:amino acid adenylation domain-containing protein
MRKMQSASVSTAPAALGRGAGVYALIEEQVRLVPEATAVRGDGRELTYAALDRKATQCAWALCERGVGPEVVVGLCGRRSPSLLVGLLGILKAGGGYVYIDPTHGEDRIRYILKNSSIAFILTTDDVGQPDWLRDVNRLPLSDISRDAHGDGLAPAPPTPDSVAMVIYTSGSAGKPKGVVISHRAVVTRLLEERKRRIVGKTCQKSSLSVVSHVADLLFPLADGRTVVFCDDDIVRSPCEFARNIRRHGIRAFGVVASQLHALLESDDAMRELRDLRLVVVSGEALAPSTAALFRRRLPATILTNGYGLSETVGAITLSTVTDANVDVGPVSPHIRVHILDESLQPVAEGDVGEVCVQADQLARGYLGRPDLTADRFVPSPFGPPGGRLYRTADLGRCHADGALVLIGRSDDEVKVRGYRVNLVDVELAMSQLDAIERAAVVFEHVNEQLGRLRAYVVARHADRCHPAAIRQALNDRLPEYMVPGVVELLDRLPLLPNGKVDRQELVRRTARTVAPHAADEPAIAPSATDTREMVAGIWAKAFELPELDSHANFFGLGGDSLTAMRILAHVMNACAVDLSIDDLYEHPNVEALSVLIAQRVRTTGLAAG